MHVKLRNGSQGIVNRLALVVAASHGTLSTLHNEFGVPQGLFMLPILVLVFVIWWRITDEFKSS